MVRSALVLFALPALLAGCFGGGPAPDPAPPTGQIDGAVVNHILQPFAEQEVRLVQLERTDRTSALGGFTFREVPPGFYTLTTSLPDGSTATQVVDVEAGKITRVILQLMPVDDDRPWFEAHVFKSTGERAVASSVCESCAWSIPLDGERPDEITFEAVWSMGPTDPLTSADKLHILISDDLGFPLYDDKAAHPGDQPMYTASIAGADLHPDARELRVQVAFGPEFMASPQEFRMTSILTEYFGGTRLEQFGV